MDKKGLEKVISNYSLYKEPDLDSQWITFADILPKIKKLEENNLLSVSPAGASIEGRKIYRIKAGNGNIKALLWSQMHGDENTATKAIFDIINFLISDKEPVSLRRTILDKLEIHFVPMLNPDGAEKFTRENSINIDLNRDALSLQCPESLALIKIKDKLNPDFCFNLHDQNRYYTAGKTDLTPALSLLSPPYDYENSINNARKKGMKLIVQIKKALDDILPGRIAKYSDEHEPRSFGDFINKGNSSVILIESGFIKNDPAKDKIRELNFTALLTAFESIALKSYEENLINHYYDIPVNENRCFDMLLKGLSLSAGGKEFNIDIGINNYLLPSAADREFYSKGIIEGLGDLSTFTAHKIIDCTGLNAHPGKIFSEKIFDYNDALAFDLNPVFESGHTTLLFKEDNRKNEYINAPFNIYLGRSKNIHEIKPESEANFSLSDSTGVRYLIINGFLSEPPFNNKLIRNGLIFH